QAIGRASVPQREQYVAVAGNKNSGLGILAIACWTALRYRIDVDAAAQGEFKYLGALKMLLECRKSARGTKILAVQRHGHWQRCDYPQTEVERDLGRNLIAAFGQRRQHHDGKVRIAIRQIEKKGPQLCLDGWKVGRMQVAMAGNADHQGSRVESGHASPSPAADAGVLFGQRGIRAGKASPLRGYPTTTAPLSSSGRQVGG
ncbi:MAG TPA: hypothetical protein VGE88_11265, partial [Lysobacter sp.]